MPLVSRLKQGFTYVSLEKIIEINQWPDLLAPLDPHSHTVLKEGGHKAETSQVRENMLRVTGHFVSNLEYEM